MSLTRLFVTEARAALADHDVVVAGRLRFLDDRLHVPRCEELALLDVDRLAGAADLGDEVGLAHEEGRRLQHVDHARDFVDRRVLVHVGQYRQAELALHFRQHLQTFLDARTTKAVERGAIRLVEARLEDEGNAEFGRDFLELAGGLHLELHRLDHAGAGDQEERLVEADLESAEFHGVLQSEATRGSRITRDDEGAARISCALPSAIDHPPAPCVRARHG
ncbi:hypothetical protein ACVWZN_000208 [Lysobacter sp. HA35]